MVASCFINIFKLMKFLSYISSKVSNELCGYFTKSNKFRAEVKTVSTLIKSKQNSENTPSLLLKTPNSVIKDCRVNSENDRVIRCVRI